MNKITNQIEFADISDEYKAFEEKFKPKKTTDDCYTPDLVFDAIGEYVANRYGVRKDSFIRPFWPGNDYRRMDYPDGCVVYDNPPFSIVSQIVKDYNQIGVKFFMFCPYLTCLGIKDCTKIVTGESITYENGADVPTAFVTNMEPGIAARADPELAEIVAKANTENLRMTKREKPPKYDYPDYVLTAAMLGYMAQHETSLTVFDKDTYFVRYLDSQKAQGKAIFGSGYLLSEKAAAEKAAAEKAAAEKAAAEKAAAIIWELSENEKRIIEELGRSQQ